MRLLLHCKRKSGDILAISLLACESRLVPTAIVPL